MEVFVSSKKRLKEALFEVRKTHFWTKEWNVQRD